MSTPLFSIIIPVYNAAPFILRCITSIKAQILTDYEVILVNDGSTDNSLDLIQREAIVNKHLTIISQPNGGASSARNNGIDHAHGEYLLFMDSDDYWLNENVLIDLKNRIDCYHEDVILYGCQNHYPTGRIEVTRGDYDLGVINHHDKIKTLNYLERKSKMPGSAWIMCTSRGLVDKLDLRFPLNVSGEDFYWVINLLHHCERIGAINNIAYCYFKHPGSVSSTSNIKGVMGVCFCIQEWLKLADPDKSESITRFLAHIFMVILMSYSKLPLHQKAELRNHITQSSRILSIAKMQNYLLAYHILGPSLTGKLTRIAYRIIR